MCVVCCTKTISHRNFAEKRNLAVPSGNGMMTLSSIIQECITGVYYDQK